MTLPLLRNIMRLLLALLVITLWVWVDFILPPESNILAVALFQTLPLLLVAPLFIQCRSPHMHIALPVVLLYLCFTAPNLYLDGTAQLIAFVELILNISLSSVIMVYLLKASKHQRFLNQEQCLKNEGISG